jgi:hypothetical protein
MPYKSLKQERFFNAYRASLEKQGVNVAEFNAASKDKKLPLSAKSASSIRAKAQPLLKGK